MLTKSLFKKIVMPGYELINNSEKKAVNEIFDKQRIILQREKSKKI